MTESATTGPEVGVPPERSSRGKRPANRRALIVEAATTLFFERGYDHVSMSDIAAAAGIVSSAVYRHFPSKQDLMREVVLAGITPAREVLLELDPNGRDQVVRSLVQVALARPEIGVLWRREARHLSAENQLVLRAEIHTIGDRLAQLVRATRPEVTEDEAETLGWAMFGVLLSSSPKRTDLDRADCADLLVSLCLKVLDADLPVLAPAQPVPAPLLPASRREALLGRAVTLFAESGYSRVGVEEIGASVGIAGASVYNHFPGKIDILVMAALRACEFLRMRTAEAYRSPNAAEALRRLMSSYVDFSHTHPDLVTLLVTERGHLPDEVNTTVLRAIDETIEEAVHLLMQVDPGVSTGEATLRVRAVLSVANDIARTRGLRQRIDVVPAVRALTDVLLGIVASDGR